MEPNCLRCNKLSGCIRCSKLIMMNTKSCVDECPKTHAQLWSTTTDLMGRVCYPTNVHTSVQTIFIGITCGAIICFVTVLVGVLVFKRKHHKLIEKSIKDHLIDEEYDRHDFIGQLEELKPHAECFLYMLNDTRKQIRMLHVSGDNAASAKYYPIVRDLAKILLLLNRPVKLIESPPHDWNRLLLWADRILASYTPQKITQLIEFLQTPTPSLVNTDVDSRLSSQPTSFKSLFYSTPTTHNRKFFTSILPASAEQGFSRTCSKGGGSNLRHESLPFEAENVASSSLISMQELEERNHLNATILKKNLKHKRNSFDESFQNMKKYLSSGSLWMVEDEFIEFKLGSRPQDEITTEL